MSQEKNKTYNFFNPLLGLLAAFNIVLTVYCCTQYFVYLPTSDTWVHIDFLARAAQGHLDVHALFEKHNRVHLIVLPKLVYFFDVWLTRGSGALTMCVSLLAQVASAGIFIAAICSTNNTSRQEKFFIIFAAITVFLSACQVESLLNPANLQWSLLTFGAVMTAWFVARYLQKPAAGSIIGLLGGIVFVGLTSGSSLLIIAPALMVISVFYLGKEKIRNYLLYSLVLIAVLLASAEIVRTIFFPDRLPLWFVLLQRLAKIDLNVLQKQEVIRHFSENAWQGYMQLGKNWLEFTVDFFVPPIERLHWPIMTALSGVAVCAALYWLATTSGPQTNKPFSQFLAVLLLFSLLVIVSSGLLRFYGETAFTFRFVNIGLVFSLTLLLLLRISVTSSRWFSGILLFIILSYMVLLTYINTREAAVFGFGRNHYRLNQIAYALDIREPYVVTSMPGTVWQQQEYEFVQGNKHKLQENGIGIYSDPGYQQVGKPIASWLRDKTLMDCTVEILKGRRLLPEQAAYKFIGRARSVAGKNMSQAYFVDMAGTVRGMAVPVMSSMQIVESIRRGKSWAGFANLDAAARQDGLQVYVYEGKNVCAPQTLPLPAYRPFSKKE